MPRHIHHAIKFHLQSAVQYFFNLKVRVYKFLTAQIVALNYTSVWPNKNGTNQKGYNRYKRVALKLAVFIISAKQRSVILVPYLRIDKSINW